MHESEIKEVLGAVIDSCETVVESRKRWVGELERGVYSEQLLRDGVSKRELIAHYRGEVEVAKRVIDDLSPTFDALSWKKPGGAATPPDGGNAA